MHIQVPHKMSASQAVGRVKTMLNENRGMIMQQAKINKEEWKGDTLNFDVTIQGKEVTGTLEVTDQDYILDAKLPLLWRVFEGRIEKEIKSRVGGLG